MGTRRSPSFRSVFRHRSEVGNNMTPERTDTRTWSLLIGAVRDLLTFDPRGES